MSTGASTGHRLAWERWPAWWIGAPDPGRLLGVDRVISSLSAARGRPGLWRSW